MGAEGCAERVPRVLCVGHRKHVKPRVAFPIVPIRTVEMMAAVEVAVSVLLTPSVSRGGCALTVLQAASVKSVVTTDVVVRAAHARRANHVMHLVHVSPHVSRSVLVNSAAVMGVVGPAVSVLLG